MDYPKHGRHFLVVLSGWVGWLGAAKKIMIIYDFWSGWDRIHKWKTFAHEKDIPAHVYRSIAQLFKPEIIFY